VKDFTEFGLAEPIMQALAVEGHATPTPIQVSAIPPLMAGQDLLGIAQTGTGKTAAFALPILNRLAKEPRERRRSECRVLVLAPTRELAAQVLDRFEAYGKGLRLRTGLVIGGAPINRQKTMARNGADIIVATPGRLVDLMDQGALVLDGVEMFVLDEVDQMLDLGFIHAIRAIAAKLPAKRQNIFFSATMPTAIAKLASALLDDPVRVEIVAAERPRIAQSVMFMENGAKVSALVKIVRGEDFTRGLVFTRTKHGADKVVRALAAAGAQAHAIHGNRSQSQRERALEAFRAGYARVLVATDIAARGIDVTGVSHVVNYDLPNVPETYVHRIGRTARAGAAGIAISFCSGEDRANLRSIERLTRERISVVGAAEEEADAAPRQHNSPVKRARPAGGEDNRRSGQPHRRKDKQKRAANDQQRPGGEKKKQHRGKANARPRRRRNRPAGAGAPERAAV